MGEVVRRVYYCSVRPVLPVFGHQAIPVKLCHSSAVRNFMDTMATPVNHQLVSASRDSARHSCPCRLCLSDNKEGVQIDLYVLLIIRLGFSAMEQITMWMLSMSSDEKRKKRKFDSEYQWKQNTPILGDIFTTFMWRLTPWGKQYICMDAYIYGMY